MEFTQLLEFINLESGRLQERFPNIHGRERVLARAVKLSEELGELCSEVLASGGDQRKEKLAHHNKLTLQNEFADVIITTLLLAQSLDVDIQQALEQKIEEINKRYE